MGNYGVYEYFCSGSVFYLEIWWNLVEKMIPFLLIIPLLSY